MRAEPVAQIARHDLEGVHRRAVLRRRQHLGQSHPIPHHHQPPWLPILLPPDTSRNHGCSTSAVRAHVLAALGVLKLATADQMHRLMAPGRKDNKGVPERGPGSGPARSRRLRGQHPGRRSSWNLTPLGPDAPAEVLDRPPGRGGTARGAARSGAPHAVAVNETVIAITRTPATATRPVPRRSPPRWRARRGSRRRLRGSRRSRTGWAGSVPGRRRSRSLSPPVRATGPGSARTRILRRRRPGCRCCSWKADCAESAVTQAAKFEKYLRHSRLKSKNPLGSERPVWRTQYR